MRVWTWFKRRWRWWVGTLAVLVVLLLVVFRLALPAIAQRSLAKVLGTDVHISGIALSIVGDKLVADGVRVAQPEGFEGEPLLEARKISISGWRGALGAPRDVDDIRIEGLTLHLISRPDDTSNLDALFGSEDPDTTAVEKAGEPFSLLVRRASLSSITVYSDTGLEEGGTHRLELVGDELNIDRFAIGDVGDIEPGEIEFTGGLVQQDAPRAEIYFCGRFADLGSGAVSVRFAARVTGCLFETFVPLIPDNTGELLGGEGFDAQVDNRMANRFIDLEGEATTSTHAHYGFSTRGPVDDPDVDLPDVLASVASRMRGSAGRVVRSTFTGGKELLTGTAHAAGSLGKGGLSMAGEFLSGAGKTAAGLLTADTEKIGEGTTKMTKEAGGEATEAIGKSAGDLESTSDAAAGAIGRDPGLQKWLDSIGKRHSEQTEDLFETLRAAPFPPALGS